MTETKYSEAEISEIQKIGEASGMGVELPKEESEPEEGEQKKEESESKSTPKSDNEPEEGESDEEDKEDDKKEEKDENLSREDKRPTRTVPYNLLKAEREKQKNLREEMNELREMLAEIRSEKSGKSKEEELDDVEQEAEKLAEELGLDSKGLAKILRKSVELAEKKYSKEGKELPKEIQEKLKILDTLEAKSKQEAEEQYFEKEWGTLASSLKKDYPNAGDNELKEAKKLLDELSHTKEFHQYDLDYVVFKNKQKFETILKVAPKNKSGEEQKKIGKDEEYEDTDDEERLPRMEDITPQIMKARELRSINMKETSPRDYHIQNPMR